MISSLSRAVSHGSSSVNSVTVHGFAGARSSGGLALAASSLVRCGGPRWWMISLSPG